MARPDWPRTIMDFQERFATEAACLEYLAASRSPDGFACPACAGRRAWVLERGDLWECTDCHRQTPPTVGTVMHGATRVLGPGASGADIAREVKRLWELNRVGSPQATPTSCK